MRMFVCSVLLWVFLIPALFALPSLAQTVGRDDVKPNFRDLIRKQLQQGIENIVISPPNPQKPKPNDTTVPPNNEDGTTAPPQPPPKDTEPPVIIVSETVFTSWGEKATIKAVISDDSGRIEQAFIDGPNGRVTLTPTNGREYTGAYPVTEDYRKKTVVLMAEDPSGNWSKKIRVAVGKVPGCGVLEGVSKALIENVQRDLNRLGGYGLGVDGVAGTMTCDAIWAEATPRGFGWPWLAGNLRQRVAISQISLDVTAPEEIIEEIVPLTVSVIDPLKSGVVRWVSMQGSGEVDSSLPNQQELLGFRLRMSDGEQRKITFVAQDEVGGKVYATKTIELYRLPEIALGLSGADLIANRITSEDADVMITADLSGTESGQIFYGIKGQEGEGNATYRGAPVSINLTLPAPGETAEVVFQGRSGRRVAQPVAVLLERLIVHVPDPPQISVWRGPGPGMDQPPMLNAETRPVTAATPQRAPEAEPDLPPKEVDTKAPVKDIPGWLVLVFIVTGLLVGTAVIRKMFDRDPDLKPVTDIRLVAVPDTAPIVEVTGADMPGLILRVEPGRRGESVVTFEDEYEEAAQ